MSFFQPKTELVIVEVEKQDTRARGTPKELQSSLLALREHLGFEELLRRFRVAKAMIQARLNDEDHADIRAVDRLQALLKAYGFVERQLRVETGRLEVGVAREAYDAEKVEFERLHSALEIVGR